MCGPSNASKQLASGEQSFSNQLQANYAQNFGQNSAILSNLSQTLSPIVEAGPNQQGFSPTKNAALTSGAINSNAAAYRNASAVAGANSAAAGGNTYAPSGAQQQVNAGIASNAAEALSSNENQITEANYATGRANFEGAVGQLSGVANDYNPNALAGEATGANSSAANQEQQLTTEENAWVQPVAGLIGGLGGAAIGKIK